MTVTPDLAARVSTGIRKEYENARDYYALDRGRLTPPFPGNPLPSRGYLEWDADTAFRG